jgi:hypothetical protein
MLKGVVGGNVKERWIEIGVWQVGSTFKQCAPSGTVLSKVKLDLLRSYSTVRATLGGGLRHLAEWKSKENSLKEFPHCQVVYILTKEWPKLNIELRQIRKLQLNLS